MQAATPTKAARPGRRRRITQRALAYAGAVAALLWVVSLWQNLGFGIDAAARPTGWGASKATVEASLVRGGVLLIFGGTRTDSIAYDPLTSFSMFFPFGGRVYILDVHTVAGPVVWWPRYQRPAPWSGPYIFLPLWPIALGCIAAAWRLWVLGRQVVPGICPACRYPLAGLPAGAACPECGNGGAAKVA